ncbi:MAG: hypothetical protein KJ630_15720 [Proteobacteria bacterium]|nr:hypothetical protein [Pseudomonadota bacterium]
MIKKIWSSRPQYDNKECMLAIRSRLLSPIKTFVSPMMIILILQVHACRPDDYDFTIVWGAHYREFL